MTEISPQTIAEAAAHLQTLRGTMNKVLFGQEKLIDAVLIGLLATDGGLFYGGGVKLLVVQIVIALCAIIVSGVVTTILGFALKATMGWRISQRISAKRPGTRARIAPDQP